MSDAPPASSVTSGGAPDGNVAEDARVAALRERILSAPPGGARARGGGSKSALAAGGRLDLSALAGVLTYDPGEYTFTALAGTPLREIDALLARERQHLPFDPPLADAGATLGGTVAAGLSGSGRQRWGGVRDFLLGVRFLDGRGRLVTGGGRVVKNAAGFDLPKLMTGSLGRFGVLVELTFKVFPAPEASATVERDFGALEPALDALVRLARSPLEPACLDLRPPGRVRVRVAGLAGAVPARAERVRAALGGGEITSEDAALWRAAGAFAWRPPERALVRVALSPARLAALERDLAPRAGEPGPARRYAVGGSLLWLAWPAADLGRLDALLAAHDLPGTLLLRGAEAAGDAPSPEPLPDPRLGTARTRGAALLARVASALDPDGKFAPAPPGPPPPG